MDSDEPHSHSSKTKNPCTTISNCQLAREGEKSRLRSSYDPAEQKASGLSGLQNKQLPSVKTGSLTNFPETLRVRVCEMEENPNPRRMRAVCEEEIIGSCESRSIIMAERGNNPEETPQLSGGTSF
ncbi:hypothetical protein Nepgr_020835 [Nepenthes gracilis]|uniref:Uncharacterized protein n=1 Tax=Nepenthes gracilis TaxID=150966 RepID=A0AAD3SYF6_NEPGR|nr:hypothetical protein Nepgr_020835 [Nepenthes gracilis]